MGKSLKKQLAEVRATHGEDAARAILADLTPSELEDAAEDAWWWTRRPEQTLPPGNWRWLYLNFGRGTGKTRAAAENTHEIAMSGLVSRIALVAKTPWDAREVMIDGPSGIVFCARKRSEAEVPQYEPSKRRLTWPNGCIGQVFSGENPEQARGPQFHFAWIDELAAFQYVRETFTQINIALRLDWKDGGRARGIITTTPKPHPLIRELIQRARNGGDVTVVTASTYDNAENLDAETLEAYRREYEGTRLGRQELHAELLEDVEGAWWKRSEIDEMRKPRDEGERLPDGTLKPWRKVWRARMQKVVVAVDPAATSGADSDETGIIVAGLGVDGLSYVLEDLTCRLPPAGWAERVLAAVDNWDAEEIVAEVNQGGEMVKHTIEGAAKPAGDQHQPYRSPRYRIETVHAKQGKRTRAEPVHALYEKKRVHHVGSLDKLEDQMTSHTGAPGEKSPDRLDAMVYAVTRVAVGSKPRFRFA